MIETLLKGVLAYVAFIKPVIVGAQLCNMENPDPKQVANATLALVFSWGLTMVDTLFLSSFTATRNLYAVTRIVLCLYFSHPTFLGALRVYEKALAPLLDVYGPTIDALIMQHMDAIAQSGIVHYCIQIGMSLFRVVVDIFDIAKRLAESTADTNVPAAKLPRRFSVGRTEPVKDEESDPDQRPEEQYMTPSVVAKVRRTASEKGYASASSSNVGTPPPEPLRKPVYERADEVMVVAAARAQALRRPPTPPPAPPPRQRQRYPFEQSYEEGCFDESISGSSTPPPPPPPPPAMHRREREAENPFANYYHGNDYGYN